MSGGNYIGCDLSADYYQITEERLAKQRVGLHSNQTRMSSFLFVYRRKLFRTDGATVQPCRTVRHTSRS